MSEFPPGDPRPLLKLTTGGRTWTGKEAGQPLAERRRSMPRVVNIADCFGRLAGT